ncbi:MAG: geranylgeranylglycerol-phosphate geranylgeranyltransferase [Gemmatimonadales bacterium]
MTDGWRLLRVHNLLLAAAGVVAGGWIALGAVALPKLLAFAAVSGAGLGAAGNVANDLHDAAADRVNRPAGERPIAAGRVARDTAHLLVWLGTLLGLGAAALVSGWQLAVGIAALVVMLGYSPWLKRYGPPGNLAVAAVAGLPPFYGALAVGRPAAGLVPWVLAAWIHLAREIVKDLQDEAGDRLVGRRTLPLRVGRVMAQRIGWWICLGFVPLSVVLPLVAQYRPAYFAVLVPAQLLILLAAFRLRRERFDSASRWLKLGMAIGLVALVLGGRA